LDDQIKKNEMGKECGTCWYRRGAYRVLVEEGGDLRERDNLEDLGKRWEDNIKIYLKEIECVGVE
jgi:hypothetical protein